MADEGTSPAAPSDAASAESPGDVLMDISDAAAAADGTDAALLPPSPPPPPPGDGTAAAAYAADDSEDGDAGDAVIPTVVAAESKADEAVASGAAIVRPLAGGALAGGEAVDEEPDFWDELDAGFDTALDEIDYDLSRFKKKDNQIPFLKTRDKVYFTFGVVNVMVIAYTAGGHTGFLPWYYSLKFPLLITIRFFFYKSRKWHYFLLDFCYFANLLLLTYIWLMPKSVEILMMLVGLTCGPLGWAVMAFRNSLVFHSLDKITSAFIHITPVTLAFSFAHKTGDMWWPHYQSCTLDDGPNSCPSPFFWLTIAPTLFFVGHQILYWIIMKLFLRSNDPAYLTSFRYLTADKRSPGYKLVNLAGGKCKELIFSAFYSLFAFITMLPAYIFFKFEWVHFVFICLIIVMCVYNGACFYVEVFSRGYGGEKAEKKRRASISASKRSVEGAGGERTKPSKPKHHSRVSVLAM